MREWFHGCTICEDRDRVVGRLRHRDHPGRPALLHAGVDISVIELWLGHVGADTAQVYLHADMAIKNAPWLAQIPMARYRAPSWVRVTSRVSI